MATRQYINGLDIVLFIKRINAVVPETEFRAIACLESNTFSGSKEKKVVNNKCTSGWEDGIPGKGNWSIKGNGQAITDVDPAEANYQELSEIWAAGEIFELKMANADNTFYRGGIAMITSFSEAANTDDPLSFDATFDGLGVPVMVLPDEEA